MAQDDVRHVMLHGSENTVPDSFDPSRLTRQQRVALAVMFHKASNPYGWSASDLGVSGSTMQSLWGKGLVHGGHIYGSRTRTFILSNHGQVAAKACCVAIAMEARSGETEGLDPKDDSAGRRHRPKGPTHD